MQGNSAGPHAYAGGPVPQQQATPETIRVVCNGVPGIFILVDSSVICGCTDCAAALPPELLSQPRLLITQCKSISPTEFERHAGMGATRKWRHSIKVLVDLPDTAPLTATGLSEDDAAAGATTLLNIGRWLDDHPPPPKQPPPPPQPAKPTTQRGERGSRGPATSAQHQPAGQGQQGLGDYARPRLPALSSGVKAPVVRRPGPSTPAAPEWNGQPHGRSELAQPGRIDVLSAQQVQGAMREWQQLGGSTQPLQRNAPVAYHDAPVVRQAVHTMQQQQSVIHTGLWPQGMHHHHPAGMTGWGVAQVPRRMDHPGSQAEQMGVVHMPQPQRMPSTARLAAAAAAAAAAAQEAAASRCMAFSLNGGRFSVGPSVAARSQPAAEAAGPGARDSSDGGPLLHLLADTAAMKGALLGQSAEDLTAVQGVEAHDRAGAAAKAAGPQSERAGSPAGQHEGPLLDSRDPPNRAPGTAVKQEEVEADTEMAQTGSGSQPPQLQHSNPPPASGVLPPGSPQGSRQLPGRPPLPPGAQPGAANPAAVRVLAHSVRALQLSPTPPAGAVVVGTPAVAVRLAVDGVTYCGVLSSETHMNQAELVRNTLLLQPNQVAPPGMLCALCLRGATQRTGSSLGPLVPIRVTISRPLPQRSPLLQPTSSGVMDEGGATSTEAAPARPTRSSQPGTPTAAGGAEAAEPGAAAATPSTAAAAVAPQTHTVWLHAHCASWCQEARVVDGRVVGLPAALKRAHRVRCCSCGRLGGSIVCASRGCGAAYHLPCARQVGCVFEDGAVPLMLCPSHAQEAHGGAGSPAPAIAGPAPSGDLFPMHPTLSAGTMSQGLSMGLTDDVDAAMANLMHSRSLSEGLLAPTPDILNQLMLIDDEPTSELMLPAGQLHAPAAQAPSGARVPAWAGSEGAWAAKRARVGDATGMHRAPSPVLRPQAALVQQHPAPEQHLAQHHAQEEERYSGGSSSWGSDSEGEGYDTGRGAGMHAHQPGVTWARPGIHTDQAPIQGKGGGAWQQGEQHANRGGRQGGVRAYRGYGGAGPMQRGGDGPGGGDGDEDMDEGSDGDASPGRRGAQRSAGGGRGGGGQRRARKTVGAGGMPPPVVQRVVRTSVAVLPSRPVLHNPYAPSASTPSAAEDQAAMARSLMEDGEDEAALLGGTTGHAGRAGRCAVCVIQRKGKCGTESAPRKCLRRQLNAALQGEVVAALPTRAPGTLRATVHPTRTALAAPRVLWARRHSMRSSRVGRVSRTTTQATLVVCDLRGAVTAPVVRPSDSRTDLRRSGTDEHDDGDDVNSPSRSSREPSLS